MSDVPPVDTPLGDLLLDEVFIEYDGPKLFTCVDDNGSHYLSVFADEEDYEEIYLYAAVSSEQLAELRSGVLSIRDAFKNPFNRAL